MEMPHVQGENMRENFDISVEFLKTLEGYESNDPRDKGGRTKYGISSVYNPDVDMDALTWEKAKTIYLEKYWKPLGCDGLSFPLDLALFIQGVNTWSAKRYMEESNGLLDFFMRCLEHYSTRSRQQRAAYLTGWNNRLVALWKEIKRRQS